MIELVDETNSNEQTQYREEFEGLRFETMAKTNEIETLTAAKNVYRKYLMWSEGNVQKIII